jgi:hypothetical protein
VRWGEGMHGEEGGVVRRNEAWWGGGGLQMKFF